METHLFMQLIIVFIVGLCVAFATSHFAEKKGRDRHFWFWMGLLLGVVALVVLFLLPEVKSNEPAQAAAGSAGSQATLLGEISPSQSANATMPASDCRFQQWFYLDQEHCQQGPVDFRSLQSLWGKKHIAPQTYVWTEGMPSWQLIDDLPQLLSALG